jgi:hypothetical protein
MANLKLVKNKAARLERDGLKQHLWSNL